MNQFIKDKFDALLVTGLFVLVFLFYYYNTDPDRSLNIWQFAQGLLYALLALLGIRVRNTGPAASTQTGDIVGPLTIPAPGDAKPADPIQIDVPGDPGKEPITYETDNITSTDL